MPGDAMRKNLELTTGEKETWKLYNAYMEEHGHPPTVRWLAKQLELYPNAVQHRLNSLREKGWLAERQQRITVTRLVPVRRRKT
jgi:hypothetical protein